MAKFFALYIAPLAEIEKWMANSSPEDMKKGMDEWKNWMSGHKEIFADAGSPLGKTKRVTKGAVSDARNEVTGYSIVEADSHEEAAQLLTQHPHVQMPGCYIDVLTFSKMPD